MAQLQCLLYAESSSIRAQLRESVEGLAHVEICGEIEHSEQLARVLDESSIDLMIVGLSEPDGRELDAIGRIGSTHPDLVFVGPLAKSDWILRAMRIGAREYLASPPDSIQLAELVERLSLEPSIRPEFENDRSPGSVVAVLGAKGGVGATTIACGVAAAAADIGHSATLVDLDLQFGNAALHFDASSRYSLADLAAKGSQVDEAYLKSLLSEHASGVSVLSAPRQPEDSERIEPADVENALRMLRGTRDLTVVDLPRVFDERTLRATSHADLLIIVGAFDLPAMAATKRALDLLERLKVPREKVRLVMNRHDESTRALERDAEGFLGTKPDFIVPNDYRAALEAVSAGQTLASVAPRSALTRAISGLAKMALRGCGVQVSEPDVNGHAFSLRRWIGR